MNLGVPAHQDLAGVQFVGELLDYDPDAVCIFIYLIKARGPPPVVLWIAMVVGKNVQPLQSSIDAEQRHAKLDDQLYFLIQNSGADIFRDALPGPFVIRIEMNDF